MNTTYISIRLVLRGTDLVRKQVLGLFTPPLHSDTIVATLAYVLLTYLKSPIPKAACVLDHWPLL